MQKFKSAIIAFGIMVLALTAISIVPATGFAQSLITPNDQPSLISSQTGGQGDLREFVKTVLNFVLGFLGFICVLFVIYAGFLYVTSQGDEEATGKAKKIITNAVIGIIIILASFAIVNTALTVGGGASSSTTVVTQ